jgi:hypothetical protein
MFVRRVRTVPDVFPVKADIVVDCIPSFVGENSAMDVTAHTIVPYLVHRWRKYPIEIWPNTTMKGLMQIAENVMGIPVAVHNDTLSDPYR